MVPRHRDHAAFDLQHLSDRLDREFFGTGLKRECEKEQVAEVVPGKRRFFETVRQDVAQHL